MITNDWKKASYSEGGSNCVECRLDGGRVETRDSQHPHLRPLDLAPAEWVALTAAARSL